MTLPFSSVRMGLLLGALLFMGCYCVAQPPTSIKNTDPLVFSDTIRLGVVVGGARELAEKMWDSVDAYQVERAFCVESWDLSATTINEYTVLIYSVTGLRPVKPTSATPTSVTYRCRGPRMHTHPPSRCERPTETSPDWKCELTRAREKNCKPSTPETRAGPGKGSDVEVLERNRDAFAVVQCGKNIFGFYYPAQYERTTTLDSTPLQVIPHIPSDKP